MLSKEAIVIPGEQVEPGINIAVGDAESIDFDALVAEITRENSEAGR